ncbi:MAG: hypothetical protein HOW97_20715 [Catenulispora sp.]|nr:hypothetical protein [Catenulispora sp.]
MSEKAVVSEKAVPRRGGAPGLVAAAAVLVGALLTVAQLHALYSVWGACELGGPVTDDFPDGDAYTWLGADVLRFVLYIAAYTAGVVLGRRWIRRPGPAGTALRLLLVVALCATAFGVDFAWGVRMDAGTFDPARCPGGVPTWWPF